MDFHHIRTMVTAVKTDNRVHTELLYVQKIRFGRNNIGIG